MLEGSKAVESIPENEIVLPNEILEQIYIQGIRTGKDRKDATEFNSTFKRLSKLYKNIAESKPMIEFYKSLFDEVFRYQTLNLYLSDPKVSIQKIEFLIEYLGLDPNKYVVFNHSFHYDHLLSHNHYRLENLLEINSNNQKHKSSPLSLGELSAAQPVFFIAIKYNRKDVLDVFKKFNLDLSLSAYATFNRFKSLQGNPTGFNHYLKIDHPISAFHQAILSGHINMLDYFSPGLALQQPESKSFLNFALNNNAPVATINWLLDKGVVFDPTHITLETIIENGYIRLLKPLTEQPSFDVNLLSSSLLAALEEENFPVALALIDSGAKIINDPPLWTNGPLPIAVAAMNKECFDAYLKAYLSSAATPLSKEEIRKKIIEVIGICFNLINSVFDSTYITNQAGKLVKLLTFAQDYSDNLKRLFNSIQISFDELAKLIPLINNEYAFKLVLEYLNCTKILDEKGNQFFHLFAQSKIFHEFLKNYLSGTNYEYNPDFEQALLTPNLTGQSPLHLFFGLQGDFDKIIYIFFKPDISQNVLPQKLFELTDIQGRTPLHYLFDKENLTLPSQSMLRKREMGLFIKKLINIQDNSGCTPLHLAAKHWGKTAMEYKDQADLENIESRISSFKAPFYETFTATETSDRSLANQEMSLKNNP